MTSSSSVSPSRHDITPENDYELAPVEFQLFLSIFSFASTNQNPVTQWLWNWNIGDYMKT